MTQSRKTRPAAVALCAAALLVTPILAPATASARLDGSTRAVPGAFAATAMAAPRGSVAAPTVTGTGKPLRRPVVHELTTFAAPGCASGCGSGSTVGPDGALYVTDSPRGRVLRVNPRTGATTTFARGLPPSAVPQIGVGGAMDVAFLGRTAYVLVTLVGPALGQPDVVNGIYRIGRNGRPTAIADLGAWSIAHPPTTGFVVPSGVQYALQTYRRGFLVTDGHLNRVLRVSLEGDVRQVRAFGNIVPTGLEVQGRTIYMGEAGPVPHLAKDGKVVAFTTRRTAARRVASGAPLIVDVELGRGRKLYALSQGIWTLPPIPENAGRPASPNTGRLLSITKNGCFRSVVKGLDRPTSLEFIGDSAFVVTLTGSVIRIDHVTSPHRHPRR